MSRRKTPDPCLELGWDAIEKGKRSFASLRMTNQVTGMTILTFFMVLILWQLPEHNVVYTHPHPALPLQGEGNLDDPLKGEGNLDDPLKGEGNLDDPLKGEGDI